MDGLASFIPLMPIAILAFFVYWLIVHKRKPINLVRFSATALFVAYMLFVMEAVFLPMPVSRAAIQWMREIRRGGIAYNAVPFATITGILKDGIPHNILVQIGGNIALFVPMPILLMLMGKRRRTALLLSFAITCGIELAQLGLSLAYGFAYRSFDVDDILLNGLGIMIGCCVYGAGAKMLAKIKTDKGGA